MFLLWPTILLVFYGHPYYFSTVLQAVSTNVYHHASVYTAHCACVVQVRSYLSFFIFNTYFLKLFPYAALLPHHCGAAPSHPSSHLPQ